MQHQTVYAKAAKMNVGIRDIAASLKEARLAKMLTQQQLGKRVGLPQSHISRIERGAVDLQLSTLAEIARALDLEIKLVPRTALPAVEGAVRAHEPIVQGGRAVAALNQQVELAQHLKNRFPDLPQVDAFQSAIRNIPSLDFDAASLKALNDALKPTIKLGKWLEEEGSAGVLAKRLEAATAALRQFRNIRVTTPLSERQRQFPAYRLEDDDD